MPRSVVSACNVNSSFCRRSGCACDAKLWTTKVFGYSCVAELNDFADQQHCKQDQIAAKQDHGEPKGRRPAIGRQGGKRRGAPCRPLGSLDGRELLARLCICCDSAGVVVADHHDQTRTHNREKSQQPVLEAAAGAFGVLGDVDRSESAFNVDGLPLQDNVFGLCNV